MTGDLLSLFSALHSQSNRLSEEARFQVQMPRLLSLLGAGLVVGFTPLYALANPEATDPLWGRLVVAGLLVGLFAASWVSRQVEGAYVTCTWAATYVVMGWFSALAAANRFSADYAVGLLLVYVMLAAVIGFGARSARPVLWFLGFGFLAATVGALWSRPVGASHASSPPSTRATTRGRQTRSA